MSIETLIDARRLGHDAGPIALHGKQDNRLVCVHMLRQVRRNLCLLSRDLDKSIYDQAPFLAGLKALALRSRFSRIRILLQDHEPVLKHGHRIVEFVRRLSSSAEIRIPPEDWVDYPVNFVLADQYGYIKREVFSDYEATADYFAPLAVRRMRSLFDGVWEISQADPELRRLYL
jgi:hypothetical protein